MMRVNALFILCVPQEIIQQLIDNSSTFNNKTGYAQDKYIKKKKKKWVTHTQNGCRHQSV